MHIRKSRSPRRTELDAAAPAEALPLLGPAAVTRYRPPLACRCSKCVATAVGGLLLLLFIAQNVYIAGRPTLLLRQLAQPLQWVMISSFPPRGYEVVRIPPAIHAKLADLVNRRGAPDRSYGGPGEALEDTIILGRSARVNIPRALQQEMREAFHPLASRFCSCELRRDATIGGGGVRIYHRGAGLAAHLDWAHKFVVSATLNVRQADNRTRWPLQMRAFGAWRSETVFHSEGEAVLYEGSRMLHSRPAPLDDDYYVAAFVGFVPRDYPAGRGWLTRLFVGFVRAVS